ncbi:30S ribosomal protein S1 [Candidatus Hydrogenosomobacter endosymbioticus]|uniref:30S ribosomal protein S1 n=2 Tax=Candidatus Hydrogenosomobacter endosymbioticus TaxID=2558174 RepID=A0ABM7V880_9PROT|nr:30S ribosomal protein S1 [Candidatus Hydrogenosomobacter endosymbioticus]
MLAESFSEQKSLEGKIVKGRVLSVSDNMVLIDVGLKSEGRVPLKQFQDEESPADLSIGSFVDVFVEQYEDKHGGVCLSREKARQETTWNLLLKAFEEKKAVEGIIVNRVKGGFIVDIRGAMAFLPGSQVDVRPIKDKDVTPLMGIKQPFMIIKMEESRTNIVVSRRAIMEESRADERRDLLSRLKQGSILTGVVKNITDYGAFVDLGGIDGLLHVSDISWKRVKHASDALTVGQSVEVMITRFNKTTQRISLGMKQLERDPWADIEQRFSPGQKVQGIVTNVTDCGAFVSIEDGVEGLVYVSELSWSKKNIIPSEVVSEKQEVEVVILDIDAANRRISLSLKQCSSNPLEEFSREHPIGSEVDVEVKGVTEFGVIVQVTPNISGTVHRSDLAWSGGDEALAKYHAGDKIRVKILNIDPQKELIGLGVKQVSSDSQKSQLKSLKKGMTVSCEIVNIVDAGLEVKVGDLMGFIQKSDIARDYTDQDVRRFSIGEVIEAKIVKIQTINNKLMLSIRAQDMEDEQKAVEEYVTASSGSRLGDLLKPAIEKSE